MRGGERLQYTRAERVSDAAIHVLGVVSALIATPTLIVSVYFWYGDKRVLLATFVYGITLILMFTCSAIYHLVPADGWEDRLRRVDQSAIYMKIAGTYTPLALLTGASTSAFLAGIWSVAIAGAAMVMLGPIWLRRTSILLYLAIGWTGVVAAPAILDNLSPTGFALILAGGCLYSGGVCFLLCHRLPFHKTIWHGFVWTATALVYTALLLEFWEHSRVI